MGELILFINIIYEHGGVDNCQTAVFSFYILRAVNYNSIYLISVMVWTASGQILPCFLFLIAIN